MRCRKWQASVLAALAGALLGCGSVESGIGDPGASNQNEGAGGDGGEGSRMSDSGVSSDAGPAPSTMPGSQPCPPGYYCPGDDASPEACPEGTWNDGTKGQPCQEARDCEPGAWVEEEFDGTEDRRCEMCASGTYSATVNAEACTPCDPGSFCSTGSVSADACSGQTWDADGDPATECVAWQECGEGYQGLPGDSLNDRQCQLGEWYHEIGSHGSGVHRGAMAVDDAGDVYTVGYSRGDLTGDGNLGGNDAFVRKVSGTDGSEIWTRQFGTTGDDRALDVAWHESGLFVVGSSEGDLGGDSGVGGDFVQKLSSSDGEALWTRRLDLLASTIAVDSNGDIALGVAHDDDSFVRKLSGSEGELLWEVQSPCLDPTFTNTGDVALVCPGSGAGYSLGLLSGEDGAEVWSASVKGDARPLSIDIDPTGDFVVHSIRYEDDPFDDSYRVDELTKLSGSDAAVIWSWGAIDCDWVEVSFDAEENVLVAYSSSGDGDVKLLNRDDGETLWWVSPGSGEEDIRQALSAPSGDVYLMGGWGSGSTAEGVYVRRISGVDQSQMWRNLLGVGWEDEILSVAFDARGDVFVGGTTDAEYGDNPAAQMDGFTSKVSGATGEEIWKVQLGTAQEDGIYSLAVDGDGDVVVAGRVTAEQLDTDSEDNQAGAFVRKLSGADGSELWRTRFGAVGNEEVTSVAIVERDDVVVLGITNGASVSESSADGFLRRLNGDDGSEQWNVDLTIEGAHSDHCSVAASADGDVVVLSLVSMGDEDYSTVTRFSGNDGAAQWTTKLDMWPWNGYRRPGDRLVAVDAAGDVAVVGYGASGGRVLFKLSGEDGSRLWKEERGAERHYRSVAFDPAGDLVLVLGYLEDQGAAVERASGEDGALLWSSEIEFGAPRILRSRVSADGEIVLAGTTWANVPATEAYEDSQGFVMKLLQ